MRIGSVSGIAGRGDFSLIRPVPDAETLPLKKSNLFLSFFSGFILVNTSGSHSFSALNRPYTFVGLRRELTSDHFLIWKLNCSINI